MRLFHTVFHGALKDAVRKRMVSVNVADAADPPSAKSARPPESQVWTASQVQTWLASPSVKTDRLVTMWRIFAMTGMRRAEVVGLQWGDIDFAHRRLAVRHTLTPVGPDAPGGARVVAGSAKSISGERVIDLDDATLADLGSHKARQAAEKLALGPGYRDAGLVFAKPDGTHLKPQRVSEWFARRARAAGLPPIRLHDLRHSHISILLAAGTPVKVVSERAGHASPAFTMARYQHVLPGMQADAAASFAALVDGVAQ